MSSLEIIWQKDKLFLQFRPISLSLSFKTVIVRRHDKPDDELIVVRHCPEITQLLLRFWWPFARSSFWTWFFFFMALLLFYVVGVCVNDIHFYFICNWYLVNGYIFSFRPLKVCRSASFSFSNKNLIKKLLDPTRNKEIRL